MEVLHARCAGLDVHKAQVTACRRIAVDSKVSQEVRSFPTVTSGLLALAEWLGEAECTHVAMEATGVYWKPVWHVLEGSFELVLANAQHVRNVPGRKSDVSDAMWLADLLAHGLIRGSFVPPTPVQEMRDLTRTRKQVVREVAQHIQRIQKTLEDANVKLGNVVSNIIGTSGRAFLEALIAGESDPVKRLRQVAGAPTRSEDPCWASDTPTPATGSRHNQTQHATGAASVEYICRLDEKFAQSGQHLELSITHSQRTVS